MAEHYTKATTEVTVWCKRCNALTQHRVDDGRRGPCLACIKKLEKQNEIDRLTREAKEFERSEAAKKEPRLF